MEKVGIDDSLNFQIVFMFTFSQVNFFKIGCFQVDMFSSRHFINSLILKSQFWNDRMKVLINGIDGMKERDGMEARNGTEERDGMEE